LKLSQNSEKGKDNTHFFNLLGSTFFALQLQLNMLEILAGALLCQAKFKLWLTAVPSSVKAGASLIPSQLY
jgi:hypothetical protein